MSFRSISYLYSSIFLAWCCGVDCCQVYSFLKANTQQCQLDMHIFTHNVPIVFQIDPTLLLAGICICVLASVLLAHYFFSSRFAQKVSYRRLNRLLHCRRRKRVIARANAQRRKRSEFDGNTCKRQESNKRGTYTYCLFIKVIFYSPSQRMGTKVK